MPQGPNAPYTGLDQNQILQRSFEESEDRLRVDAEVSAVIGEVTVIISHTDDSIRLGDGTTLFTGTTVGAKTGQDVNVINDVGAAAVNIQDGGNSITVDAIDLDIRDLNHSQDTIRLGDGTNLIASTTIGSDTLLNVKKAEDPTYYTRVDVQNSTTSFTGKTYDLDAATSASVWQITRTIVSGTETITQYADDENTYDKIWDNRTSLFGAIPFVNVFSIQFDGANDYIDIADNAAIDFDFRSEAASWNLWLKTSDTTSGVTYFEKNSSNVGWRFYLSANRLIIELRGTGGTGDRIRVRTDNNVTYNDGSWHMISCTYDGSGNASGITIYIDGVSETLDIQNDTLTTDTSVAANAAIAARTGGGNNFGPGNIDEVSIWDVELSSANITTIYNSGTPIDLQGQGVSPITTSLNYWARMGDGPSDSFPTIQDVENSINGTMTNMTAGDIETEVPP